MFAVIWTVVIDCAAIWMGWQVWRQLRNGRATVPWSIPRWPTILRTEQPLSYWSTIGGEAILGLVVAFFAFVVTAAVFHAI